MRCSPQEVVPCAANQGHLGSLLHERGKLQEAEDLLRRVLSQGPSARRSSSGAPFRLVGHVEPVAGAAGGLFDEDWFVSRFFETVSLKEGAIKFLSD